MTKLFLSKLEIVIADANATIVPLEAEEMYQIQIIPSSDIMPIEDEEFKSNEYVAFLYAENCFGAIRGLETFSQLIQPILDKKQDENYYTYHIASVPLTIHDHPRFFWRFEIICVFYNEF